jgi:hypothetical protein
MLRVYLTEKQIPRLFWYFTIKHLAHMMIMIPGKYCSKSALPFMLVHGVRPDQRTWLPLFSLSVTSIMRKIAMPHILKTKPTPLTAL